MSASRRRANPAFKEHAAEIFTRLGLESTESPLDVIVARVALNTAVEYAHLTPQWEKKLTALQIQEQGTALKALGLMADGADEEAVNGAMKKLERLGDRVAIAERRIRRYQGFPEMVEKTLLTTPEIATAFQKLLTETLHDAEGNQDLRPEEQTAYILVAERFGEGIR